MYPGTTQWMKHPLGHCQLTVTLHTLPTDYSVFIVRYVG